MVHPGFAWSGVASANRDWRMGSGGDGDSGDSRMENVAGDSGDSRKKQNAKCEMQNVMLSPSSQ